MKKILFILPVISSLGGAEEQVVRLALKLKDTGRFTPVLFSCLPAVKDNPYVGKLNGAGIVVSFPSLCVIGILRFFLNCLASIASVFLLPVYVVFKQGKIAPLKTFSYIKRRMRNKFIVPAEQRLYNRNMKKRLKKTAARGFPSFLHFHCTYAGMEEIMRWGNSQKIPVIYTEHTDILWSCKLRPSLYSRERIRAIKEAVTVFHAFSPILERKMKQVFGEEIKTVIIPNWVEDSDGKNTHAGRRIFTIGAAGRFIETKGFQTLVESLRMLKREHGFEFYCKMAGDGEYRGEIEKMINSLGLQGNIELPGRIKEEDMREFMSNLDVFAFPSFAEALPLVLLQAIRTGIPVIATGVGGIPDIITDGINGFVVEAGNSRALAEAILKVYQNPEKAEKMGAEGRRTFLEKYSERVVLPQFVRLYDSLIGEEN